MSTEELTRVFESLGAKDPQSWAQSQVDEGIQQLARYLFLKGAWDNIVSEDDTSWIGRVIDSADEGDDAPHDGQAHSMRRMLAAGVPESDIAMLARSLQAETVFNLCHQLSDSSAVEGNDQLVDWCLVSIDQEGKVVGTIDELHESVLETDPTGRECRPKDS